MDDTINVGFSCLVYLYTMVFIKGSYIPYNAKFSRHLYFVEWPLKAFRCTMFVE